MHPVNEWVMDFQLKASDSVPPPVRKESAHQCGCCDRPNPGVQGGVLDTEDVAAGSIGLSPRREARDSL